MKNPKLEAIAAALGATFTDPHNMGDRGRITLPSGLCIFVAVGVRSGGLAPQGKIHFTPSWPDHVTNKDGSTRATSQADFMPRSAPYFDGINVNEAKTPEQIAKEVQRRFLPVVEPMWAACVEFVARQATAYAGHAKMDALGRELFRYDGTAVVRTHVAYAGTDYLNVEVSNLNEEQARTLAAFLRDLNNQAKKG